VEGLHVIDLGARNAIGRSAVAVSSIGIGTAPLSTLGEQEGLRQAKAVLSLAARRGLNYVDTAPLYGTGLAEREVGGFLADVDRSSVVISTKAGRNVPDEHGGSLAFDFSREGIGRSLEASLERLQTDRIDMVLIHDADDAADQALEQAYPLLHELRDQGVVGAIGLGMVQSALPARFVRETDIDVVLLAGPYTLLDQSAEDDLLPACLLRGCSLVIGSVFHAGLLTDLERDDAGAVYGAQAEVVRRAQLIRAVCDRHGVPLRAAALQFPAHHPAVASVLVGARSVAELDDSLSMAQWEIPMQLWADLYDEDLLRSPIDSVLR
jgi:D-threo-aldose 1-dehydrogenase